MATKTFADFGIELPYGRTGEVRARCPECGPKRKREHQREKDLAVNVETGTWFCHHCSWKGGLGEKDWRDQIPPKPVYAIPAPPQETVLPQGVRDWFAGRGIPDWVLEEAHVTAGKEFDPNQGKEVLAVRFPYYRDGALVNVKYRSQQKTFWMAKGAERILYGLDGLRGQSECVVVEGEIDKLSVDAVHGPAAVSVPDGAPAVNASNYAGKFAFLEGAAEERFAAMRRVLIATDMDEQGTKLADELARRIGYEKCARVVWPDGCKDANETLTKHGAGAVCAALADAQPWPVAGIVTVRELRPALEHLYEHGYERGVAAGWPRFDELYRVKPGLLTIVTGIPGSGKSHFLDNILVRLADRHGWGIGVCSPENQPLQRHLAGLLAIRAKAPFASGETPRMSAETMRGAAAWAERHFAFVLPEEPTIAAILERADVLVYRMGIRGFVIDPWNELDHSRPPGMTETEFTSQSLSRLRNWARAKGVHVWLVAHPTKLPKTEDAEYPVPTPYDISGSAHFYNKADACLSVWRARGTDEPEVHVQKIRFAETGRVGMATFAYNRPTGCFNER